jgi:hypothetical protein
MAKVYVTRCIVKKDGKTYSKGSVIKDLSDEEIKQGLVEHWLEAVGNDEEPAGEEPKKPSKRQRANTSGKTNTDNPPGEDPQ